MEGKSFNRRLEELSELIEKLAVKSMKLGRMAQKPEENTQFQYYFFKNEIIELTTRISSDIEDFNEDEKKKVDAKIVFDSFND